MGDATNQNNKDTYLTWLSQKTPPTQVSELYRMYELIDKFCIGRKILKNPLFQTTEPVKAKAAQRAIEQNKVFRFLHRREMKKISTAMKHYVTYLKECQPIKTENDSTIAIENKEKSVIQNTNEAEINNTIQTISFTNIGDLSYTHPVYVSYFGEEIQDISS